jgi:N-acetylmuramoyl-L-alanine amidase
MASPAQLLADGELARAREARARLFEGDGQKTRQNWLKLIGQFEEAGRIQPKSFWRAQAGLEAAILSMQSYSRFRIKDDAQRAQRLSRAILKDCPKCGQAPGAVVILGRALAALGKADDAYRELMRVELTWPDAKEAQDARFLMSSLRAGTDIPPFPTNRPLELAAMEGLQPEPAAPPRAAAASPASSASPASTASSRAAPAPKRGPPPPKEQRAALETPVEPPVKRPKARGDGLAQVYAYTLTDLGEYSVVTAWLDQVTPYVYNLVPPARGGGSYRVYVDFRDARQAAGLAQSLKKKTALVRLVKINQFDSKTVRLVADLTGPLPYAPAFLDDPPRMELLIANDASIMPPREADAQPQPKSAPARPQPVRPAKGPADSLARQLGLKIRRVVIDPGHGGKDPGAMGFGHKEKDIALKASRMLAGKIKKRLGLEAVLTRGTDKFVTLDKRPEISRDNKGDLFISIHANASAISSVEGLETYILNFGTDPSAMTTASRENAAWDKSMSELSGILDTLAKNTKVAESRVMAQSIHQAALKSVRTKYKVRDLGVKEAVFVVLLNTEVPSALIEIGFLSNRQEAERLNDDKYLELLTDGIINGLANYIAGLPH